MRKKDQLILKGALIGIGVSSLIDFIFQLIEKRDDGQTLTWENYDLKRTLSHAAVGGAIGAGVGYTFYKLNTIEISKKAFNSDNYLYSILREEDLKNNPRLLNTAIEFRDYLKVWMVEEFKGMLVALPENSGSFTKKTANLSNFDIDIILPFKKSSFSSLQEMFDYTYSRLNMKFGKKIIVTKQTKAISLVIEKFGHSINFDIVPGREINDYKNDRKLNLYVSENVFWKRGSSFKVNSAIQRNMTKNKPEARSVIRILKIYNERNSLKIPKVLIEQGVIEALSKNNYGIYSSITENLLNSMLFIAEKLKQNQFLDYANSNNNLNEKMSTDEKIQTVKLFLKDVERIEANSCYLQEIFNAN